MESTAVERNTHIPEADAGNELLVLHAAAGDRRALAVLVKRWDPRLRVHAFRLVGDRDAARDIAQDAWLAIARGLGKLNDPARFRPWMFGICRRKAADWIRVNQRSRRARGVPAISDHAPEPGEATDAGDELRIALRTLDPTDRELLALRHVEGLSVGELAEVFSVPSGTIKSRLFAARGRLRSAIEASGEDAHPQIDPHTKGAGQ